MPGSPSQVMGMGKVGFGSSTQQRPQFGKSFSFFSDEQLNLEQIRRSGDKIKATSANSLLGQVARAWAENEVDPVHMEKQDILNTKLKFSSGDPNELEQSHFRMLNVLAMTLKQNPSLAINVEGHTSYKACRDRPQACPEEHRHISQDRALVVVQVLNQLGVRNQMCAIGLGCSCQKGMAVHICPASFDETGVASPSYGSPSQSTFSPRGDYSSMPLSARSGWSNGTSPVTSAFQSPEQVPPLQLQRGGSSPHESSFVSGMVSPRPGTPSSSRGASPTRMQARARSAFDENTGNMRQTMTPRSSTPSSPGRSQRQGDDAWWRAEAKRMRAEAGKMRSERDHYKHLMEEERVNSERKTEDLRAAGKRLTLRVKELEAQLYQSQDALRESKAMAHAARKEVQNLHHWIEESQEESRNLSAESQVYELELRDAKATLGEAERSCQDLKEMNEAQQIEIQELKDKLEIQGPAQQSQGMVKRLRKELEEARSEARKALMQLEKIGHGSVKDHSHHRKSRGEEESPEHRARHSHHSASRKSRTLSQEANLESRKSRTLSQEANLEKRKSQEHEI